MKFETTIQRTELAVEKTETLRISRTRRFVYERSSGHRQDAKNVAEEIDLALKEIGEDDDVGESLLPATLAEPESFT